MVSSPWCKQTVCRIYLSIFSHTLCGRLPRWVSKFGAYRQLTHSLISVGRCAGASIFGGPQMRHYENAICLQFIKMWHQWHISHHEIKNEIIQVLKHDELQYLSWCTSVIVTALQLNRNDAEPVKTQVCVYTRETTTVKWRKYAALIEIICAFISELMLQLDRFVLWVLFICTD